MRGHQLFTLKCPHGTTEALTNNADDAEVLAYPVGYHTHCEGCERGEDIFARLRRDA